MSWVNAALSVWVWFEAGIITMVGCTLQLLVFALTVPFDRRRFLVGRYFRLVAVTIAKCSPMWRFRKLGPYPRRIAGRTVVVSNHMSHLDSFLIAHLPWEMKWLAKESLFRVPFLGWGMAMAGDIKVRRGAAGSVGVAMQRCAAYLQRDVPVFIFPEGTRSTGPDMLPFKDGAFRLAIEAGADVLPVAVAGTRHGLAKHSWRFNFCRAWVSVGEPISTRGFTVDDVPRLKAEARERIAALIERMRPLAST